MDEYLTPDKRRDKAKDHMKELLISEGEIDTEFFFMDFAQIIAEAQPDLFVMLRDVMAGKAGPGNLEMLLESVIEDACEQRVDEYMAPLQKAQEQAVVEAEAERMAI